MINALSKGASGSASRCGFSLFEPVHRALSCGAMDPNIGHGLEPLLGGEVKGAEIADLKAGEKILVDMADAIFNAAFLVTIADGARADGKAKMVGQFEITGMEDRRLAARALQHGAF